MRQLGMEKEEKQRQDDDEIGLIKAKVLDLGVKGSISSLCREDGALRVD